MRKLAVLTAFVLLLGVVTAAQAAITTFTNSAAFFAAFPNLVTENFEDTTLIPGMSITEVNGAGSIHNGVYENIVRADALGDPLGATARYQVFNYSPTAYAFYAWVDTANPGGAGSSIDMYINDTNTFVLNIPNTANGDFFGFSSDVAFKGVRFQDGLNPAGVQETYFNVDVGFNPVPVPPAVLLFGTGLLGMVGIRLRRKN